MHRGKTSGRSETSPGFWCTRQSFAHATAGNASGSLVQNCASRTRSKQSLRKLWPHILKMMAVSFITSQTSQDRRSHISMHIDGEWALLDEGVMWPIVSGDIKAG